MKLSECYLSAYCGVVELSDKEVMEFLITYKASVGILSQLGPAFTIAFKEANNCCTWLESVALARELSVG